MVVCNGTGIMTTGFRMLKGPSDDGVGGGGRKRWLAHGGRGGKGWKGGGVGAHALLAAEMVEVGVRIVIMYEL